ncbi:excalibur calcium-binding domain-containing protein [Salana multivorans]|uniref:excalibur calcium-binding domain-containing protein n=1 Tax=Salana multivorans TaxID=120377 RepID=UPI000AC073D0|nr:excalibur calcium-binding domain-containing protein [Salana multivorans]
MSSPSWLPDPDDPARVRWWDGRQWTAHTQAVPDRVVSAQASPTQVLPIAGATAATGAAITTGGVSVSGAVAGSGGAPGTGRPRRRWVLPTATAVAGLLTGLVMGTAGSSDPTHSTAYGELAASLAALEEEHASTLDELETTSAELADAQAELSGVADTLADVETREADLATREGAVEQLESDLATRESSVADRETAVSTLESDLQTREADVERREGEVVAAEQDSVVAPVPFAAAPPASDTDPRFGTCKEAKANGYGHYVKGVDPEYAWYRDADGDGVVCE